MEPASCPADVAAMVGAGTIIICVTDTPAVEAVLLGDNGGILKGLSQGTLVIDMGTTAVPATRRFAEAVKAAGGDYMDAPVSGGQIGAEAGTLSIMAGGSESAYDRARPVFEVMGEHITHVGEVGAGQITKAANQMVVGLTLDAVAEAFALARSAGVELNKVHEALMGGFAASKILEVHGQRMLEGTFDPGGRATTQRKDIAQVVDLAREMHVELPATELNLSLWDRMIDQGDGDLDHSAIIRIYKDD
jgi:3-hydroxyisobutyrate dehydrogenase-like beta-hydroxyacid dehydrogenase